MVLKLTMYNQCMQDRLALLFMGIVGVFFVCSLPRMFLNLYETTYMEHALACTEAGMRPFPALVLFMTSISHVSLAINR